MTIILTSDWLQGGGNLGPGLSQTEPCGRQGQPAGARDQPGVSSLVQPRPDNPERRINGYQAILREDYDIFWKNNPK